VEEELSGDGRAEHLLDLEAGWYARVVIDQSALDVTAALLGPGGETVVTVDDPDDRREEETLSLIASAAGEHRLVVAPHDPKAGAGRYRVTLKELRRAGPEDADRVAAARGLAEVKRLRKEIQTREAAETQETRQKALGRAEEVLRLWRGVGDRSGEIETLIETGFIHKKTSSAEALAAFEEALALSTAPGDRRRAAKAARNVGACRLGEDPKAALESFERALAIWTDLGDVREQADVLQAIGESYKRQRLSDEALSAFQKALPLAREAKNRDLEAAVLNSLAAIYLSRGESRQALEYAEAALLLAGELETQNVKAAALTTAGSVYRRWGELLTAQKHFSEALAINRRLGDSTNEAKVLVHQGSVYQDMGELERALEEYGRALEVHRSAQSKDVGWEITTLLSIGQVHLKLGDPQQALKFFDSALEISGEGNAGAALYSVGVARLELGRTTEAIAALESALPLRKKARDRHGEALTRVDLGKAWQKQGDFAKAEPHLREGLDLARRMGAWSVEASALLGLARLHRERGDLEGALAEIREAVQILEAIRSDLPEDSARSSFFASKRPYYDFYVDLLMRLDSRFPGQGYASQALGASEAARARSLLDLLAEGRLVTQGVSPELRQQEAELAGRLSAVQRRLLRALSSEQPDEAEIASLRALVDQIVQETRNLASTIRQEHPRYAEIRYPSPLGLPQIQERLDGETALLEYFLGEEGAYLFVVTRERLTFHPLPQTGAIAELVDKVRRGVAAPSRRTFDGYTRAAHRLYEILVDPVLPALAGKSRLLIVPDGALHTLAFEALLTEDTGLRNPAELPYLLRKFAVTYVPSASVLSRLAESDAPADTEGEAPLRFLAFTDPVYGSEEAVTKDEPVTREGETGRGLPEGLRLPSLAGTSREVSTIASRYPQAEVKVYQGTEANERNVKKNPLVETARWLHFASHGLVDERQPELSGLFLTVGGEDDGLLQVYEIFNLSLRADLVVLSACETGLGKEVTGEGLVGLTRAFLYAGAPSVVVSLWRVRDDTTPELMVGLYDGLDRLGDKAEALRGAKLEMIRKGDHAHPYHWAPFILVGNPL
jgi:CHAT domain-containing protein/Tfp pilus assembly protein PilF